MDGKRIGFFGASGCGKTFAIDVFLKTIKTPVIFIDPKGEYNRRGLPVAFDFRSFLKKTDMARGVVVSGASVRENLAVLQFIQDHAKAPLCVVVDECQEVCPSGTFQKEPNNPLLQMARLGRSRGLSVVVASQRIKTVDINLRGNLNTMALFRQGDFSDAREIKKMTGENLFDAPARAFLLRYETGKLVKFKDCRDVNKWF